MAAAAAVSGHLTDVRQLGPGRPASPSEGASTIANAPVEERSSSSQSSEDAQATPNEASDAPIASAGGPVGGLSSSLPKFTTLSGLVVPCDRSNVDTDMIIQAKHLKVRRVPPSLADSGRRSSAPVSASSCSRPSASTALPARRFRTSRSTRPSTRTPASLLRARTLAAARRASTPAGRCSTAASAASSLRPSVTSSRASVLQRAELTEQEQLPSVGRGSRVGADMTREERLPGRPAQAR